MQRLFCLVQLLYFVHLHLQCNLPSLSATFTLHQSILPLSEHNTLFLNWIYNSAHFANRILLSHKSLLSSSAAAALGLRASFHLWNMLLVFRSMLPTSHYQNKALQMHSESRAQSTRAATHRLYMEMHTNTRWAQCVLSLSLPLPLFSSPLCFLISLPLLLSPSLSLAWWLSSNVKLWSTPILSGFFCCFLEWKEIKWTTARDNKGRARKDEMEEEYKYCHQ